MIDFTNTLDRLEVLAEHVPWPQVSKTRFFHWVTTTTNATTADPALFPRLHLYTVSTPLFAFVYLASVMGLYGLLLVNTRPSLRTVFLPNSVLRRTKNSASVAVPLSTRTKQRVAFPLWCLLVGWPLLVRCESALVQMGVALFAAWTGQRTLDLYFIQPWSGVGEMRRESYRAYIISLKAVEAKEAKETKDKEVEGLGRGVESIEGRQASDSETEHGIRRRSVRLQLVRAKKSSRAVTATTLVATSTTTATIPNEPEHVIGEESQPQHCQVSKTPERVLGRRRARRGADSMILNWDWDRCMIEFWLPMRKFSRSSSSSPSTTRPSSPPSEPSRRFILASDLLWTVIVYKFLIDWLVYRLSFISSDWVKSLGPVRYGIFVTMTGALIMLMTLWPVRYIAWIYHRRYRHLPQYQKLDVEEWPMLGNPLPCFATNPIEFWLHWHTILRYIWVDLGFLPTQTMCRRVLTKERVGKTMARLAEEVLPVMAVFTLSGLLHAYVVMAVWRESGWSQMAYFWIQGVAVVLTKGLERTRMGEWIRNRRQRGSKATRLMLGGVGWTLMMMGWHVATVPLFVEPYLKSGMWLDIKELSPVWWIMSKVAS